jgi:hypothetical protein
MRPCFTFVNNKMEKPSVAIVIPLYRSSVSKLEAIALQQCQKVFAGYDRILVKPLLLDATDLIGTYNFSNTVEFDGAYFDGIAGYNKLMLSAEFYSQFLAYEYILIYQADAFAFRDELPYWCNQGIDYVGAPWLRIHGYPDMLKAVKSRVQMLYHARFDVQKHGRPSDMQFVNRVGNGGFSLRRVKKFHDLSVRLKDKMQRYLTIDDHYYNEDSFWSIEVNRTNKQLNIPGYKKASRFAFENAPQKSLKITSNALPFGCHAWDKHLDFWRPIFKEQGYTI